MPTRLKRQCAVQCNNGGWYCTLPKGHDGDHIATVGLWSCEADVLARWADKDTRIPVEASKGEPTR